MDLFEIERSKFKPEKVRVLFVAESRPASGEFIYLGNSPLFDSMLRAFKEVFENIKTTEFLNYMKDNCYYLDDLCLIPVNEMKDNQRIEERENGISGLSDRLKRYKPDHLICIMKAIQPHVEEAVKKSGISLKTIRTTYFPAYTESNKEKFHRDVVNFLRKVNSIS